MPEPLQEGPENLSLDLFVATQGKLSFLTNLVWFCSIFGVKRGPNERYVGRKNNSSELPLFKIPFHATLDAILAYICTTWGQLGILDGLQHAARGVPWSCFLDPFLPLAALLEPTWRREAPGSTLDPPKLLFFIIFSIKAFSI